jgi:hypothetical protein
VAGAGWADCRQTAVIHGREYRWRGNSHVSGADNVSPSVAFAGFGLLAGFAGGPVTYFTLPSDGYLIILGHVGWHTLICFAIYFGVRSRNLGADD